MDIFWNHTLEKTLTSKIHTNLLLGIKWCIFHIVTSGDIDDAISPFFMFVQTVCLHNKTKIT